MSKYAALGHHLDRLTADRKVFGFADIEAILGFPLPASARKHKEWWGNTDIPGRHSAVWVSRGWHAADPDLARQHVAFVRVGASPPEIGTSRQPRASRPTRSAFDPAALTASDFAADCAVTVKLHWQRLGSLSLSGEKIVFPAAPAVAGIYRMIVRRGNRTTIYVGEAVNLSRRFGNYRNPGNTQQTSLRLNALLRDVLAGSGTVALDIAYEGVELEIGGRPAVADLTSKPIRRLVEQAAIVAHGGIDVDMLNL